MVKDVDYYDIESASYSEKRYGGKIDNFIKYFFNRRLGLFLSFLKKELSAKSGQLNLLDIGCADGFVMSKAYEIAPERINRFVGTDTSEEMLKTASGKYGKDHPFDFFKRGQDGEEKFDVIVELGVPINNLKGEFAYILDKLKENGIYIFSTPGSKDSLYSYLKKDFHVDKPLSFSEYDHAIEEFFDIKESKNYAFFMPFLWKFPGLGRALQPLIENIFSIIAPSLFHEKIYILEKKNDKNYQKKTTTSQPPKEYFFSIKNIERTLLLIRYLFSGGLSFATNIVFLYIFATFFHIWYLLASTFAFIVAFVVSFLAQKFITFQDKSRDRVPREVSLYLALALFNLGANALMMYTLVDIFNIQYLISQVISAGLIAVWNLAIYRYIIFPKRHDL